MNWRKGIRDVIDDIFLEWNLYQKLWKMMDILLFI